MLASLLTTERLRALSGFAFERGQQYWREGRVLACALDEGTLDGIVTGGITYHVRVVARGGDLAASCTCPVKIDMCKHAVALALAYLARRTDSGRLDRSHVDTDMVELAHLSPSHSRDCASIGHFLANHRRVVAANAFAERPGR